MRLRSIASLTLLALTLLFASCDAPEARVEVALITDAIPGLEFHFVELDLFANGASTPQLTRAARVQVATGDRFQSARTITRFLPVAPGSYHLEARLVARDGVRPVLDRNLEIDVREDMRIVIRLDRACITVECPGSGVAGATECVGGRCEDPTCASSPLTCPTRTGCTSAADCPRSSTCSASECVDGVCFAFPSPDACPTTSYCDLSRGCVPYDGGNVCGQPCTLGECGVGRWSCGTDGSMTCIPFLMRPPGEPCGDGVCDGTGACEACVPGAACSTGNACEVGVTDCSSGTQVCVGTGPRGAGTECRAASGVCDAAEVCDGTSVVCPSDARVSAGSECRASSGDCDVAEVCDGTSDACPSDALQPSSYVCRTSIGACDSEERCDGASAACPSDARTSAGTVCRAATGACDSAEVCDGAAATCPSDALRGAGAVCRAAASSCDVQEVCSGSSNACPIDGYVVIGNACTAGFCNGMGMCLSTCTPGAACSTGNPCEVGRTDCGTGTPRCLPVGPGNAGAVCRMAAGPCDVSDVCSGTSTVCTDVRAAATVVCRAAAAGGCDVAERCNGTAVTCPTDAFSPATTTCRVAAAGGCDLPETCTGTTAACPADRFAPASLVCRASAGFCDVAESCSGTAAACPTNGFQPSSLQCRTSAGVCDVAESCTGSAAACPTDAFRTSATVCRASTEFCDLAESCTGSSVSCPANGYRAPGTVCAGGMCNTTGMCVAPMPPTGCPLIWSAGLNTDASWIASALTPRFLFLQGNSSAPWSLGGSPAMTQQGVFVTAPTGTYVASAANTTTDLRPRSVEVGLGDRFYAPMLGGYGEYIPTTGAVTNAGTLFTAVGNGAGSWRRAASAPWVFTVLATEGQGLAGVSYPGTDWDVLVALINPATGTPTTVRRLVLPGSNHPNNTLGLSDGGVLASIQVPTAGVIDGVTIPAGNAFVRMNAALTVLSARVRSGVNRMYASPISDLIVLASSAALTGERADGTLVWMQPGNADPLALRVLDDGRIVYVATITNVQSIYGQTWGTTSMRTLIVAELDAGGNFVRGRQIPYATTSSSTYPSTVAISPDGTRVSVAGSSTNDVVTVCGTTLVNGAAQGSFVFVF